MDKQMENEKYTMKNGSYVNWGDVVTGEEAMKMVSAQNEWNKIAPKHMIDQVDKDVKKYIKVIVDYKGNDNYQDMVHVVSVDDLIKSSISLLSMVKKNNNHEIMDLHCSTFSFLNQNYSGLML
jgi:hypothetical protein